MKIYAVIYSVGGFTKEDVYRPAIAGVYTNNKIAEAVKKSVGYGASVVSLEMNEISPGYIKFAKEILKIDIEKMLEEEQVGLRDLNKLDQECLMEADEFLSYCNSGAIIPDDGFGYWATDKKISDISAFENQPTWATHVCWYNK